MTGFFISIIFIGVSLILITLFLIFLDKKRNHDYREDALQKKEDLIDVIKDAEQMLIELNKFSDYIMTQMDSKNKAVQKTLKEADKAIANFSFVEIADKDKSAVHNSVETELHQLQKLSLSAIEDRRRQSSDLEAKQFGNTTHIEEALQGENAESSSKVIPMINIKHKNVVALARKGMDNSEIARRLEIGKGEVELIRSIAK